MQRRAALEEAIVHIDAPAPSTVVKDKAIRHTLRGDLDAIVLKALKKAPEQRYETAAAFADDIERYLNRLPVQAQRASRAYRLRRFLARNRFAVGAVSAVIWPSRSDSASRCGRPVWRAQKRRAPTRSRTSCCRSSSRPIPRAAQASRVADLAMLNTIEQRIEKEFKGSAARAPAAPHRGCQGV